MQQFKVEVTELVGSAHVLESARLATRNPGWCSTSLDAGLLIRPATTVQLAQLVELAARHGISLVPHGGLTGLTDATHSAPGEAIISCERLNKIVRVDPLQAVLEAQAGVTLEAANAAAASHGMMLGVDIPSRGSCTLGGIISTNAGGARVIRYGMTRENVLGLEVVLPDGRIMNAMNTLMKNNTGFDLKQLFIGAEGTLGIVSSACFKLYPRPIAEHTAMIASHSLDNVIELLARCRKSMGASLLSFELVWDDYYAITTSQPGFGALPLNTGYPLYGIVECGSWNNTESPLRLEQLVMQAMTDGLVSDAVIAKSEAERAAIWRSREDSEAVSEVSDYCLNYDVGFEMHDIGPFVSQCKAMVGASWPTARLNFFGHIGDGNLHVMIGLAQRERDQAALIDTAFYQLVAQFARSTISAEHGIGLSKRGWLNSSRSAVELDVMQQFRDCLDPLAQFNRHKVLARTDKSE